MSNNGEDQLTGPEFYKSVIESLAKLQAGQEVFLQGQNTLAKQVMGIQTSISELYTKTNAHDIKLAQHESAIDVHILHCPNNRIIAEISSKLDTGNYPAPAQLKDQVQKLEGLVIAIQSDKSKHSKWIDEIVFPIIRWSLIAFLGYLAILFAVHQNLFVSAPKP